MDTQKAGRLGGLKTLDMYKVEHFKKMKVLSDKAKKEKIRKQIRKKNERF